MPDPALATEVAPQEAPAPALSPAATRQPFVVPAGEERRALMAGSPQETPLHIYGSGRPGKVVMVLGGVHGNEPAGWLAAERVQETFRPMNGALLVVPRANRLATIAFDRTGGQGDLNRSYPGDRGTHPMARMAAEIVAALREFQVEVLLDMHESWGFYKNRPQNGTAFLGQTVATAPQEPGITLVREIVASVNRNNVRSSIEEFFDRQFPGPQQDGRNLPFATPTPGPPLTGSSSLSLHREVPGLTPILVEMGQQQALERRVQLHVDIFHELTRRLGLSEA